MKNYSKFLIGAFVVLSACAPKITEREFPQPTQDFGPRQEDSDLGQKLREADSADLDLTWQGTVSTAAYFQQAENLVFLGKLTEREAITTKGLSWIEGFYKLPQAASSMDFSKSPFASLAATETEADVKKALQEVNSDLDRSRTILKNSITALAKTYIWPVQGAQVTEILERSEGFTKLVYNKLGSMGLPSVVSEGVKAELKKQTEDLFKDLKPAVTELYGTSDFVKGTQILEGAIAKVKVELPSEVNRSLSQGRLIAKGLNNLTNAQGGLTILIDIWRFLTPEERELNFKKENESLYDFLSKQSDKELECLRLPDCSGGFFKGIAKKLFILPEIKAYGIENLKNKLNEKSMGYLIAQVETYGLEFAVNMPTMLIDLIDKGLVEKNEELQEIQKNYSGYLAGLLNTWSQKKLSSTDGKIPGFEAPLVTLTISNKTKMSVAPSGSTLELKGNNAGASILANALLLQHGRSQGELKMRTALSLVNKLIAVGGYQDESKKLVPALMMPVEKTQTLLDLRNLNSAKYAYRIPDKLKLTGAFSVSAEGIEKNFTAAAFAEQLKGLSEMINVTADWKTSVYDDVLGKVKAQELTSEIENPALARSLFPKDMIFALNLGDAAVLLKNITNKATPVFLLTLNQKLMWANDYGKDTNETTLMAGLVDIKEGQRANNVKAQDVAKLMIAVRDFLKATEGVENTKSPLLLEKDEAGVTPLQTLLEGRRDLRLLMVALANFISNQTVNEQSLVQSTFYLNNLEKSNDPNFRIEDQAYAIRGLLAAWEITGMDIYLWSAQDIYFAMNKHAFNRTEQFYVNGDNSALTFPQKVNTLRAILELKPSLKPESRIQLEKVAAPWLKALEELQ